MNALDPLRAFRALNDRHVRFVVVGGVAQFLHGEDPVITTLEICCHDSEENRDRLSSALRDLASTNRETAATGDRLKFNTAAGPLDCLPLSEEIERNAVQMAFDDVRAFVAT